MTTTFEPQDLVLARSLRGKTVADMARAFGVPESTWRGWEAGREPKGEERIEEIELWLDLCAWENRTAAWSWRGQSRGGLVTVSPASAESTHVCGPWSRDHRGVDVCAVCGGEG